MKKLLALMMALVMTMSLVTISNAAFSDADSIEHTEAVDVMNTLGVINGMGDGSFAPKGNVTRAQMAKMIAIIMLGDVDGAAFVGTSTDLKDITGHWAEGFIKYCYSQGVIAGKGEGKFDPDASVTAAEAAKMLLVAIGYNATVQGYVGGDWQIAVARDAQLSGFYEDLKGLSPNAVLTRDQAAQMIYNAVVADMIKKTPTLNITTGTIQYTYEPDPTKSLLSETFGAYKVEGEAYDNEFMSGTGMKGKTSIILSNGAEIPNTWATGNSLTFNVDTGANELGKSVTLYVRLYKSNPNNADKATVLGSVFVNDNNDIFTTGDQIKADKIEKKLKEQGLKLGASADVMTNFNWDADNDNSTDTVGSYAALAALTGNGIEVSFVDLDGDGYIDNVLVLEMSFGKVTSASTKGDGLLNVTKLGNKGNAIHENEANDKVADFADLDLAKGDYVKYIYVDGSDMYYVAKAEGKTVSVVSTIGEVGNDGGKFVADATYKKSTLTTNLNDNNDTTLPTAVEVGKDAVVYLDDYGYVLYVTEVESTTTYLMIEKAQATNWGDGVEAKVLLSDGTKKTVQIAEIDNTKINASNASTQAGTLDGTNYNGATPASIKIYSYTVKANGDYVLTTATTDYNKIVAGVTITAILSKKNPTLSFDVASTNSTLYADNTTPFVVKDGSNISFYTGINNVPTRTNGALTGEDVSMYAVKNANDTFASIVFVFGGKGSTSSSNFIYFLSDYPTVTKDEKGNKVYTYDVVRDGEQTTVVADRVDRVIKAGLYNVTFTGNEVTGVSTAAVAQNMVPVAAASLTSSSTSEGVVNGYFYNEQTKFFSIKDGKMTEASAEDIITEGLKRDMISIVLGGSEAPTTAKYVFIEYDSDGTMPMAANVTTDAGIKALENGIYTATNTALTGALSGSTADQLKAGDIRVVKFEGIGSDSTYTLRVWNIEDASDVYYEGTTTTLTASSPDNHFIFFNVKPVTWGCDFSVCTEYRQQVDWPAGVYAYSVTAADGTVCATGNLSI